jgi:glycosyltransferase involved in cell wall biosynthesis
LKKVLISNAALPSNKIGSWTNRITKFLERNPNQFDFILSPTENPDSQFIYCKKKRASFSLVSKLLRRSPILASCIDYFQALDKLSKIKDQLHLVVIDDLALLEGIAIWKSKNLISNIRLDFSFHGHSFILPEKWGHLIDRICFLTHLGYLDTLKRNDVFVPQIHVVGNGTDSDFFYPLSKEEKAKKKLEFGYKPEEKVLVWVSNNRPKKGLNLFLELSKSLSEKYSNLQILIIGASLPQLPANSRIKVVGKVPNIDLPKYLQLGDIYCFTSLWNEGFGLTLIEAAKSGNVVVASQNGGIPEVVIGLNASFLVKYPNQLSAWEESFAEAWELAKIYEPNPEMLEKFHPFEVWEEKFLQALAD